MDVPTLSRLLFGLAALLAMADWAAVARRRKLDEYIFKPATTVAVMLAAWLLTSGPHDEWQAPLFIVAFAFSFWGDVFLMLPDDRYFLPGVGSFLLAQICFVLGLNRTLPPVSALVPAVPIAVIGGALFRGVAQGLKSHGPATMIGPVAVYSLVLSLMLFSAWSTLFRPEWTATRKLLVIVGGTLFFISDSMLAWDRFVRPFQAARLLVIITYHLALLLLAGSIATP